MKQIPGLKPLSASEVRQHVVLSSGDDWELIADMINRGVALAWEINGGEAHMIARVERAAAGREFVVMCFEGTGISDCEEWIDHLAVRFGCSTVRAHAQESWIPFYKKRGWAVKELVFGRKVRG